MIFLVFFRAIYGYMIDEVDGKLKTFIPLFCYLKSLGIYSMNGMFKMHPDKPFMGVLFKHLRMLS